MLLTHALALFASQFVHKKKSQRIYSSMHSAGLELTKLTHTRLEDNLIRHRGILYDGVHQTADDKILGSKALITWCGVPQVCNITPVINWVVVVNLIKRITVRDATP